MTIHNEIDLLPDGFPTPSLQVEIFAHFPWVIEEENEYVVSAKNKAKRFDIIAKLKNVFCRISKNKTN